MQAWPVASALRMWAGLRAESGGQQALQGHVLSQTDAIGDLLQDIPQRQRQDDVRAAPCSSDRTPD